MSKVATGLRVERRFTTEGTDPYDTIEWSHRDSRITNPDGSIVFEMLGAEIPAGWSQVAADIMVSKYFRKAGVPQFDDAGEPLVDEDGQPVTGPERSAKQVFDRLAGTWRHWGEKHGYFASTDDASAFEDELKYMLATQMAAPNSPQWFNTGLFHSYGLTGPAQGFWYVDPETEEMVASPDSYSRPSPHACFILSVKDDLVNPGGIMDLWTREARIFKFGSGAGSNFSSIRAENEQLSGGGKSSGVMSFLKIGDRAAGAIKSGGTTRRAAKMVILDVDHPDVETFVDWKKVEEEKARLLIQHGGFPADFNGEAYATVSGQNSNNSVRVTNDFVQAVMEDGDWHLINRSTGDVRKTIKARDLWSKIAEAAWACADPGLQFDTTINEWHTCPAGGRIKASNPCSEYMFLDDTACNLASLNLIKFYDTETSAFDIEAYQHAIRIWTIVLEISVAMAHFPSAEIAQGSYDYRTLGLGYANLGSLLMQQGIAYDSDRGRAIAGALTAVLTGYSYATSAEMASVVGTFPRFEENREHMLRVIRNHRRAAYGAQVDEFEGVTSHVMSIDQTLAPLDLLLAARESWDLALTLGEQHGYRNAQATVLGTHRHHRSADGLRHHGRRARLRFGQVQEAGRRRVLQDRQPVGGTRPSPPRLHGVADRRRREVHRRHVELRRRTRHRPRRPLGQGLHRRRDRQAREDPPDRVRVEARLQRVRGGRSRSAAPRLRGRRVHELRLRSVACARLLQGPDHPRPTTTSVAVRPSRVHRIWRPNTCRCSTPPTRTASTAHGSSITPGTSR